jgi:hypothetical protein
MSFLVINKGIIIFIVAGINPIIASTAFANTVVMTIEDDVIKHKTLNLSPNLAGNLVHCKMIF